MMLMYFFLVFGLVVVNCWIMMILLGFVSVMFLILKVLFIIVGVSCLILVYVVVRVFVVLVVKWLNRCCLVLLNEICVGLMVLLLL